ncbi:MAG: nicotinate-nucleotide adenylyltransferase [Bacteroidales bacterium]|jgi:nicotinate-nucleotide adenylyltransferase|nr:nicotinate-nucleotide adenylyltransferase [Bacteroidales bacterium]
MEKKNNIGLFFGSFNPIHIGHLAIANYLYSFTDLDEIWFVVSPQNPLKEEQTLLNDGERLKMVALAIENYDGFQVCDIEFSFRKPSYTIHTLDYLQTAYPEKNFYLIIGEDSLADIHLWKDFEKILERYHIYVYNRSGNSSIPYAQYPNIQIIKAPLLDISSTFIRQALKEHKDVRFFLPEKAYDYIKANKFYS